jgi:hypothetical protein
MPTLTSCIKGHDNSPGPGAPRGPGARWFTRCRLLLAAPCLLAAAWAQDPVRSPRSQPEEKRLPDGKLQSEEILKADHQANLKDLESMQRAISSVLEDLKKNDRHVLSIQSLRQLEEIEKTARRVRGRMQRF